MPLHDGQFLRTVRFDMIDCSVLPDLVMLAMPVFFVFKLRSIVKGLYPFPGSNESGGCTRFQKQSAARL